MVIIGGVLVGDYDYFCYVFVEDGGVLVFEKIVLKLGKLIWFGMLLGILVLGLLGNLVFVFVVVCLFLFLAVVWLNG